MSEAQNLMELQKLSDEKTKLREAFINRHDELKKHNTVTKWFDLISVRTHPHAWRFPQGLSACWAMQPQYHSLAEGSEIGINVGARSEMRLTGVCRSMQQAIEHLPSHTRRVDALDVARFVRRGLCRRCQLAQNQCAKAVTGFAIRTP
eukprot:1474336-Pyramimonas_sp.AAC.1